MVTEVLSCAGQRRGEDPQERNKRREEERESRERKMRSGRVRKMLELLRGDWEWTEAATRSV